MKTDLVQHGEPSLILAPMEGVTDYPVRRLLTARGGFSFCVSEFLRVTDHPIPRHVFERDVPEVKTRGLTCSGAPVVVQLLGGNAGLLALSARNAIDAGAQAIDLNFGCPAPIVNRHDGGAVLLKYPERIEEIVSCVRAAVPAEFSVSAKLRLGFDSMESIFENAKRAENGGASWITIHARTKTQGYAPPAHWRYIGEVRKLIQIPVVANGEIWSLEDFNRCRLETGAEHFMVGRGVLANPSLVFKIARELGIDSEDAADRAYLNEVSPWADLMSEYMEILEDQAREEARNGRDYRSFGTFGAKRIKQWLRFGHTKHALPWFSEVKRLETGTQILGHLRSTQKQIALNSERGSG